VYPVVKGGGVCSEKRPTFVVVPPRKLCVTEVTWGCKGGDPRFLRVEVLGIEFWYFLERISQEGGWTRGLRTKLGKKQFQ